MPETPSACPSCGARISPGADRCDLCGESATAEPEAFEEVAEPPPLEPPPVDAAPARDPAAPTAEPERQFCMACGAENPAYARFCWRCGTALYTASAETDGPPAASAVAPSPSAEPGLAASGLQHPPDASGRPPSPEGKRALMLVGGAVLVVLVLFFVTQWSKNDAPTAPTAAVQQTQPPPASAVLPDAVAAQVATLEDEIAAADSPEARRQRQRELVELLARNGAFVRAAELQVELAEAEPTALAWADAGSFWLAAMLRTEGPERAGYARSSIEAYERSLDLNPADLDVKTDLATAYLNDPQNPMQAVELVREVLEEDPDHIRARFNYGLMLAQINRLDQAQEQFEHVIGLTEPGDPVRERAEQELARVEAGLTAAG